MVIETGGNSHGFYVRLLPPGASLKDSYKISSGRCWSAPGMCDFHHESVIVNGHIGHYRVIPGIHGAYILSWEYAPGWLAVISGLVRDDALRLAERIGFDSQGTVPFPYQLTYLPHWLAFSEGRHYIRDWADGARSALFFDDLRDLGPMVLALWVERPLSAADRQARGPAHRTVAGNPAWSINGDFYVDFGQCTVHLYGGQPEDEFAKIAAGLQMADVNDPATWTANPLPP